MTNIFQIPNSCDLSSSSGISSYAEHAKSEIPRISGDMTIAAIPSVSGIAPTNSKKTASYLVAIPEESILCCSATW